MIDDRIRMATFSGGVYKCCLIARGKFTGYVEAGLNPHDVAAVEVIVTGAGGKVTDAVGGLLDYSKPFRGVVVSNNAAHDEIMKYCA